MNFILFPLFAVSCSFVRVFAGVEEVVVDLLTGTVDGVPLPGDLADLQFTTDIGRTIASILQLQEPAQGSPTIAVDPNDPTAPCQKWAQISIKLTELFKDNTTMECTDLARAAIRAGFHDAGTWSKTLAAEGQDYGGADGSLYLFDEGSRPENNGLQTIIKILGELAIQHGVSVADMFQWAAAHATVTCPLGARMRTFIGRKEAMRIAPDGLLPDARANATTNVALFLDKNIGQLDLVALVGAHSVSRQFNFDTSHPGTKLDSTPGVWDTKFYEDTVRSDFTPESAGITTLPSDKALSLHGPLQNEWNGYAVRQNDWIEHYSRAYLRLSLTGVKDIQNMMECTNALPLPVTSFP